jgi:hypothetical protein
MFKNFSEFKANYTHNNDMEEYRDTGSRKTKRKKRQGANVAVSADMRGGGPKIKR